MKPSTIRLLWELIKDEIHMRFCKHEWKFYQELSGDIRNLVGGRYEWRCTKCNKAKFTDTK